ncbi:ABC transporter substrate-binding protein [Natrinema sp. 1APR25-10V2]|uniref:ABC transporter substrate-binding protein n=1 Tax=Natrinema sp. 1APR25-10V2 TaxID=2951081 RepID=UPI002873FDC6|nr:ABC transporter substrate-binding protein [Natrinema sp. 1APR25-10V2]MDS0473950.1 ABC transporter substrate-binding protein [Natrinema sp. 1APR25-10V2]
MANEGNNACGSDRIGKGSVGRRTFIGTAGAGAVTTAFAGCLGGVDGGGSDDGTFKIGHLAPTGMAMGRGSKRSAEIAVNELEENDGMQGQEIELIDENTELTVSTTKPIVERMVNKDNVDLIVGTFSSEVTQGIIDTVADANVPFIITGSADSSTLLDTVKQDYERYKNVFRTGPINSELQAEAIADYAEFLNELHGWTDFAHLPEKAAWTKPFRDLLPGYLEDRGLNVVYDESPSVDTSNFTPFLDDIESAGADAVIRFFATGGRGQLLKDWAGNYPFALEGVHVASMSPQFWSQTNGGCIYETTSQSGGGGVAPLTDKTMDFVNKYEEEYADGKPPSKPMYMGFNTYDALHFYDKATEEAGTTNYADNLQDIVDAMLSVEHTGAAAEISLYGKDSDYPNDVKETRNDEDKVNYPITQWQPDGEGSGQHQVVYPEADATNDHTKPSWM